MNRQPEREKISPDYTGYHDVEVIEISEVRQSISLMKRIVDFIMTCRAPGIVAVLTPFVLWRIGHSMSECGDKLSANAIMGNLAICMIAVAFGGVGLALDWKNHATISQKPRNLPLESRNGRVGAAETRSPPRSDGSE
ncbi:MAG: hypothetical protein HYX68_04820 [Planctomycetes bacterium]|nr:hypothetical protein [Planctomycetota bacterium]